MMVKIIISNIKTGKRYM